MLLFFCFLCVLFSQPFIFFFQTGLRPVPFINRNKDLSLRLYIVVAYSCLVLFSNLLTRIYGVMKNISYLTADSLLSLVYRYRNIEPCRMSPTHIIVLHYILSSGNRIFMNSRLSRFSKRC